MQGSAHPPVRPEVDAHQPGSYPRAEVRQRARRAWTREEDSGLSEIEALALGLLIGIAAGAVAVSVFRVRPRAPREIKVTVTPNDLPHRRATTLAVGHGRGYAAPPGRGGPGDPVTLGIGGPPAVHAGPTRTGVLGRPAGGAMVAFPIARAADLTQPTTQQRVEAAMPLVAMNQQGEVGVRPASGAVALAERPGTDETASSSGPGEPGPTPGQMPGPTPTGSTPAGPSPGGRSTDPNAGRPAARPATGPCADERRVAAERCDLADRLGEQSAAANQHLRDQQRAYDELAARAARAATAADPREIRAAKEAARVTFRRAHGDAHSRAAVEAAATDWLTEINRINQAAREAMAEGARSREASAQLALAIERLGLEADVARINAESAAEACHLAREALAACEEAQVDRRAGRIPVDPAAVPVETARPKLIGGPEFEPGELDEITPPAARAFAGAQPKILRMLRGDGDAVRSVVQDLAGDDPDEQRRWQLLLSHLVDACVARAIEASSLEFPADRGFWSPFSQAQSRDIATALASLGYRFDGLGGFADGRVPSQRDLSLALGYAGLDPMRMRTWPNEATMPHLFDDVRVAADEYVASTAGDLTLGEMVALLHGRAEPLADLWNNWGRIRPLLLEA